MSRNSSFEEKKQVDGLVKVELWVPAKLQEEFYLLADGVSKNKNLAIYVVREAAVSRFISFAALTAAIAVYRSSL